MGEKVSFFEALVIKGGALYQGQGLSPEGRANYWAFIQNLIDQNPQFLSNQLGILDRYTTFCSGEDSLSSLDTGAFLALNYTTVGPLRGFWHTLLASKVVKDQTGKNIRWIQSWGSNKLVAIIHDSLAKSVNGILVGHPEKPSQGVRDVHKALHNKEIVGIYPEGQPSRELGPAEKGAGGLIYGAALKGRPTIVTSVWAVDKNLNMHFELLEPDQILAQVDRTAPNPEIYLKTGAYIMAEIANHLPKSS